MLPGPRDDRHRRERRVSPAGTAAGQLHRQFTLAGMQTVTRNAQVQLSQDTVADATLGVGGRLGERDRHRPAALVDKESAAITSGISNEQIQRLPVGQEYRDLIKLIPGVQVHAGHHRGPSAGGSGQDNVYLFDGVNVTLPLFGTLVGRTGVARHRAGHGDQGRRAGGRFRSLPADSRSIRSASRARTRYTGQVSYQFQNASMAADAARAAPSVAYKPDRSWSDRERRRPDPPGPPVLLRLVLPSREPRGTTGPTLYGALPNYQSTRNEGFGKLTFTPTQSILINGSYRDSKRVDTSDLFPANRGADDRHRQRDAAEDRHRRRIVGHQRRAASRRSSTRDFAQPGAGPPGQHRQRQRSTPRSARGWTSPTSTRSAG